MFAFSDSSWSQQAELASSDGGGAFGYSVAVSGTTAIVVENYNNSFLTGAAFAFVRSGSSWTQQAKLAASDLVVGDGLTSAAVSGNFAVFGAPGKNGNQGEAYVFAQTGTAWTQQAELTATDATSADSFGSAIAVNGEHGVDLFPYQGFQSRRGLRFCAFGFRRNLEPAGRIDGSRREPASARRFRSAATPRSSAPPTLPTCLRDREQAGPQQAKLVGSDAVTGDSFGGAVAIDGGTAVVGASAHNNFLGAAYVFVRSGATWTQQAKLTASDAAANDQFGTSESMSGDTILTGVPSKNSFQGAAYVFVRSGTTWTQQAELTASDGVSPDNFGHGISLSGDTALVGAYLKNRGDRSGVHFCTLGRHLDPASRTAGHRPRGRGHIRHHRFNRWELGRGWRV